MTIAVFCIAAMALLIFLLGLLVSLRRGSSKVIFGLESDPTSSLNKAARAHGNASEYVPALAVLMLYLGTQTVAPWVGWTMIAAAVARYLVVFGFLTCRSLDEINIFKAIGAMVTYAAGIALCVAAVMTVA